jgi:phosphoribosyl 1,2-cyclic phosphate phosphodiesterase
MPLFADEPTLAELRVRFGYVFDPNTARGGGLPDLRLWRLGGPFCIGAQEIIPVPIMHGDRQILGYRFGRFAYLTDCSAIPSSSFALLSGLDVLALDALRWKPHYTHFSVAQAVAAAQQIGAAQTYFIHIAHDLGHAATCAALPSSIALAYDGLTIDL